MLVNRRPGLRTRLAIGPRYAPEQRGGPRTIPLTRHHLTYLGAVLAALIGQAVPARVDAAADRTLSARLESSRWEGLSVRYPPSTLHIVRSPADQTTAVIANVDRLVSESGNLEVTIAADDAAVGTAGEYIRIDLNTDMDTQPSVRVTYRARGKTWEVASGLIGDKVFYYKAVEFCPPAGCDIPIVSSIKFRYAASKKAEYDKLLEKMVQTFTPATGRLE